MAETIHWIAQGIDDIRVAVLDERGHLGKLLQLLLLLVLLLLVTEAAIPLIPIAFVVRRLAR